MKDKKQVETITNEELIELFNKANLIQDKLQYFSRIRDYNVQMELLSSVPSAEVGLKLSKTISLITENIGNLGQSQVNIPNVSTTFVIKNKLGGI